jgi:hypothetical protein
MRLVTLIITIILSFSPFSFSQFSEVTFTSSDTALNNAFVWAKEQALFYRGSRDDPVGPWYEAALPARYAFCMRDASHQCIGAEILGMSRENKNMFTKFVSNISESKKWCSFWEIDKWNKPAPADYLNDNDFWYNLNANFDVVYACWRLYSWTGDTTYISNPVFLNFFEKSLNEYVHLWQLEPDSLLNRPKQLNVNPDLLKRFRRGFGLPSYAEGVPDLAMSTDLISAIYQGHISYSNILRSIHRTDESRRFSELAHKYAEHLEVNWWDPSANLFNTWYTYEGQFGKGEGEAYFLWFDILSDESKIEATIDHLTSRSWNVENTSYFPALLYLNGYWDKAYKYLLYCSDPGTKRREYPEVSFGVIEGIVEGYMGISANATDHVIGTLFRTTGQGASVLKNLPILNTSIDIAHYDSQKSKMHNNGKMTIKWKVGFMGRYKYAKAGNRSLNVNFEKDRRGNDISYVEVVLNPGQEIEISVR